MAIVDTQKSKSLQQTQICTFLNIFFWKEIIIIIKLRRWKIKLMPLPLNSYQIIMW